MAKKAATTRAPLPRSAAEVWRFIVDQGGLDVHHYDLGIAEDLRVALDLPPGTDIEQALLAGTIGVEQLVEDFLRVAAPYAQMLVDLLTMFENAGARQSDHNLKVTFDFGKLSKPLEVDLTHFREWLLLWRKSEHAIREDLWDYGSLWSLNQIFRGRKDVLSDWSERVIDPTVRNWAKAYIEERQWHPTLPPAPHTGIDSLDLYVERAWNIWLDVVRSSAAINAGRAVPQLITGGDTRELFASRELSGPLLHFLESDRWAGSMAVATFEVAERIAAAKDPETVTKLEAALEELFSTRPSRRATTISLIEQLTSILNLPLWKRRHELYSAWVSSQIVAGAQAADPRVLQVDGAIHFSFKGSHLATLEKSAPRLHLWAELRSPLNSPKGKGRKKAIQPDYTVAREPVTSVLTSVLVVECKQYRKASASNFAAALADYARGRPNAHVVLVNYGPADPAITDSVPPEERDRVTVIGRMHPGSLEAMASFRDLVASLVRPEPVAGTHVLPFAGRLTLTWRDHPQDLDLHLWVTGEDGVRILNYSSAALPEAPYGITLNADVRTGTGPEVMEIPRWMPGMYWIGVHNFSAEVPLAGCGAQLTFNIAGREIMLTCPERGEGSWWAVASYDAQADRLEIWNRIVDEWP